MGLKKENPIKIIHVDDEEYQLKFTKMFLEKVDQSITVNSISSPNTVLKKYLEWGVDCIVSDYQMPEMDGIELASTIRKTSDIPFILYTGRGSEEVAEKAFQIGINDYLRKEQDPSHYHVLANCIRNLVSLTREQRHLKESERRYRMFSENASDVFITLDLEGRFTFFSKKNTPVFGYDADKLLGKNIFEIITQESREIAFSRIEKWKSGVPNHPSEIFYFKSEHGNIVPFEINPSSIIENGKLTGMQMIVRNVAERLKYRVRLTQLHKHAIELVNAKNIQQICYLTLNTMELTLGFTYVAFLIVENNRLNAIGARGAPRINFPLDMKGKGITVKAANTQKTILINDLTRSTVFIEGYTASLSELVVPVIVNNSAVAVLNVEALSRNAFTEQDRELLEILALHVSSALERIEREKERGEYEEKILTLKTRMYNGGL